MTRPFYQTPLDEERQEAAATIFIDYIRKEYEIDFGFDPQPKGSFIDFLFYPTESPEDSRVVVEVKGRNIRHKNSETWFVSETKMLHAWEVGDAKHIPVALVYVWGKEVWFAFVRRDMVVRVEKGGNLRRNDGMGDVEPMIHFRALDFKLIGNIPERLAVP